MLPADHQIPTYLTGVAVVNVTNEVFELLVRNLVPVPPKVGVEFSGPTVAPPYRFVLPIEQAWGLERVTSPTPLAVVQELEGSLKSSLRTFCVTCEP
jgi:hypothetical protein